jgi:UrcA family protein
MNRFSLIRRSSLVCLAVSALGLMAATNAQAATDTHQLTVRYSDASLSTIAGAHTVYGRIQGAARFVCGEAGRSLAEQRTWQACYRGAVADAVASINSPLLTAVHQRVNGETPVTAMLER